MLWPQVVVQVQDPSGCESVMSVCPAVLSWWQVVHSAPVFPVSDGPSGNGVAWSSCIRDAARVPQYGLRHSPSRART